MTCAALRSVRVVSTCTWRRVFFFVSHRVTCRIGNTPPWSSMGRATTVSARCQVYSRPVSPTKATSVNCSAGRSGMVPLRQVSGSNPAAAMCANRAAAGFDPLTWRKGTIPDLPAEQFTDVAFTGETGREYTWHLADTVVALPIDGHGGVFPIRHVTRWDTKKNTPRQVHVLTTRTDLSAAQVIYRMGARWRLENYFRYARMHFDLDSHHCYASADDDAQRLVPNPAKRAAHLDVQAVRARHDRAQGRTDAAMLAARSPAPGTQTILTNPVHDAITADLRAAGADLAAAQQTHKTIPTRVPLGELHPGQQVLDVETKLITHAIGAAAFNTINALARDIRLDTGYARANHEAHTLARHVLTHSGDIDPADGVLTVRLDPMPTARATAAIRELCEHLTATGTRYPGTDLTLRYEIKTRP